MKKEFVRLQNLLTLTYEGDTAEARAAWLQNVKSSVGEAGYCFAQDDDGCGDTAEFACDEMQFADVDVYDFMGSALEQERFYRRDIVTFKHKATGEYYVLNAEDLYEF